MNRHQIVVTCVVAAVLLVVAAFIWRMSPRGTEDRVGLPDTPIGQPENLLENVDTGQNAVTDKPAEERGLAERRSDAVNNLIKIVGQSFLEDSKYRLDGYLISASADKLDYYDWSNIYYNSVGIDRLDGSNTERGLGDYQAELIRTLNAPPYWSLQRDSDESRFSVWRQFLLDNNIMPVGENEGNVYIWSIAFCHDELPVVAGGSGALPVAFVYSDGNSSVCREISFEGPQCMGDLISSVSWWDLEDVLAGGSRKYQCQ